MTTDVRPTRAQLRRTKGWRMPPNTVKVDRSTRWGNPYPVGSMSLGTRVTDAADAVRRFRKHLEVLKFWSVPMRHALICRRDGRRYTPDGFSALWQRAMAAYVEGGGTRFTFHDIRAKSASDAGSDQEAADRLNHSDPSITRRVYRRLPRLAKPLAWRGKNEKA